MSSFQICRPTPLIVEEDNQNVGEYHRASICKMGSGAAAHVIAVDHRRTNTRYALKSVPLDRTEDVDQLFNEAMILQHVHHPNIVKLYQFLQTHRGFYLVLEALKCNLNSYINEINANKDLSMTATSSSPSNGGLPESIARRLFQQITASVHCVHAHHIAHNDIRCENIVVDYQGSARLIDFGRAIMFDPETNDIMHFAGAMGDESHFTAVHSVSATLKDHPLWSHQHHHASSSNLASAAHSTKNGSNPYNPRGSQNQNNNNNQASSSQNNNSNQNSSKNPKERLPVTASNLQQHQKGLSRHQNKIGSLDQISDAATQPTTTTGNHNNNTQNHKDPFSGTLNPADHNNNKNGSTPTISNGTTAPPSGGEGPTPVNATATTKNNVESDAVSNSNTAPTNNGAPSFSFANRKALARKGSNVNNNGNSDEPNSSTTPAVNTPSFASTPLHTNNNNSNTVHSAPNFNSVAAMVTSSTTHPNQNNNNTNTNVSYPHSHQGGTTGVPESNTSIANTAQVSRSPDHIEDIDLFSDAAQRDVFDLGIVLYIILTGENPFLDYEDAEEIVNGPHFGSHIQSAPARQLVKGMINFDTTKQYTLGDVCHHPWFAVDLDAEKEKELFEDHGIPPSSGLVDYHFEYMLANSNNNHDQMSANSFQDKISPLRRNTSTIFYDNVNTHHSINNTNNNNASTMLNREGSSASLISAATNNGTMAMIPQSSGLNNNPSQMTSSQSNNTINNSTMHGARSWTEHGIFAAPTTYNGQPGTGHYSNHYNNTNNNISGPAYSTNSFMPRSNSMMHVDNYQHYGNNNNNEPSHQSTPRDRGLSAVGPQISGASTVRAFLDFSHNKHSIQSDGFQPNSHNNNNNALQENNVLASSVSSTANLEQNNNNNNATRMGDRMSESQNYASSLNNNYNPSTSLNPSTNNTNNNNLGNNNYASSGALFSNAMIHTQSGNYANEDFLEASMNNTHGNNPFNQSSVHGVDNLLAANHNSTEEERHVIQEAFHTIDLDSKGYLSMDQIRDVIIALKRGENVSKKDVQGIYNELLSPSRRARQQFGNHNYGNNNHGGNSNNNADNNNQQPQTNNNNATTGTNTQQNSSSNNNNNNNQNDSSSTLNQNGNGSTGFLGPSSQGSISPERNNINNGGSDYDGTNSQNNNNNKNGNNSNNNINNKNNTSSSTQQHHSIGGTYGGSGSSQQDLNSVSRKTNNVTSSSTNHPDHFSLQSSHNHNNNNQDLISNIHIDSMGNSPVRSEPYHSIPNVQSGSTVIAQSPSPNNNAITISQENTPNMNNTVIINNNQDDDDNIAVPQEPLTYRQFLDYWVMRDGDHDEVIASLIGPNTFTLRKLAELGEGSGTSGGSSSSGGVGGTGGAGGGSSGTNSKEAMMNMSTFGNLMLTINNNNPCAAPPAQLGNNTTSAGSDNNINNKVSVSNAILAAMAASNFSPSREPAVVAQLRKAFDLLDRNHSGTFNTEDLKDLLIVAAKAANATADTELLGEDDINRLAEALASRFHNSNICFYDFVTAILDDEVLTTNVLGAALAAALGLQRIAMEHADAALQRSTGVTLFGTPLEIMEILTQCPNLRHIPPGEGGNNYAHTPLVGSLNPTAGSTSPATAGIFPAMPSVSTAPSKLSGINSNNNNNNNAGSGNSLQSLQNTPQSAVLSGREGNINITSNNGLSTLPPFPGSSGMSKPLGSTETLNSTSTTNNTAGSLAGGGNNSSSTPTELKYIFRYSKNGFTAILPASSSSFRVTNTSNAPNSNQNQQQQQQQAQTTSYDEYGASTTVSAGASPLPQALPGPTSHTTPSFASYLEKNLPNSPGVLNETSASFGVSSPASGPSPTFPVTHTNSKQQPQSSSLSSSHASFRSGGSGSRSKLSKLKEKSGSDSASTPALSIQSGMIDFKVILRQADCRMMTTMQLRTISSSYSTAQKELWKDAVSCVRKAVAEMRLEALKMSRPTGDSELM